MYAKDSFHLLHTSLHLFTKGTIEPRLQTYHDTMHVWHTLYRRLSNPLSTPTTSLCHTNTILHTLPLPNSVITQCISKYPRYVPRFTPGWFHIHQTYLHYSILIPNREHFIPNNEHLIQPNYIFQPSPNFNYHNLHSDNSLYSIIVLLSTHVIN
jgi:hypothetical protein